MHSNPADSADGAASRARHVGAPLTLRELARQFDLPLLNAGETLSIRGVCALDAGRPEHLAYAAGSTQAAALAHTRAAAVIISPELAEQTTRQVLVAQQPKLAFARIAALFEYQPEQAGVHPSAVIHAHAHLENGVMVGAHAVIGAGCVLGAGTCIGANATLGDEVHIGANGRIGANVSIHHRVRIGARVCIEANAVIGARGFGLVHNGTGWEQIPQLGAVVLGDDVEIGASSTIDRGTLADTVLENDVRVDNQVHIGHNCHIGAHTVICGCSGIAGSCTIGAQCMIGGGVGIGDHVRIVDGVMITAASQVPHDITEPGAWSSTFRAMPAGQWRRLLARFRRLKQMDQRLKRVEITLGGRTQQD